MRPSPIRHCPECGAIDPALILGVLTGRLSQLDRLFYQASRPPERASATRLWLELYRIVHDERDETSDERAERIGRIDKLAAVAGLSPIQFHLREFQLDISHAVFTSPNPGKALDRILHDTPKRGQPKRGFREGVEMASAVEKSRSEGATLESACREVAASLSKTGNLTGDAVRLAYKRVMRDGAAASLVRLIAARRVEF
jgi:hypothetical protein